jgi:hypothetical protein
MADPFAKNTATSTEEAAKIVPRAEFRGPGSHLERARIQVGFGDRAGQLGRLG